MAMAVHRQWASLPTDMATEIANRLPCAVDRERMAAACKAWRKAAKRARPPLPPLPSLLLAPADGAGVYCYLSARREHGRLPGPRHFGSHDGAWLFLADRHTRGHRLLNVRTGASRALPDELEDDGIRRHGMVVLAATLAFPPDQQRCIAAGIVSYQPGHGAPRRRGVAFWRPGDEVAVCDVMPDAPVGPGMELEDVLFYGGSFRFLTRGGHIVECFPILDDDRTILLALSDLMRFRFQGDPCSDKQFVVRARYLVESRGQLLMVVRFAPHHHGATSSFKVFQPSSMAPMDTKNLDIDGEEEEEEEEEEAVGRTWIELAGLDGRMLFVGRGCSRSYEVSDYPGFKDGIFFLDDRSFYDDEMMFGDVNQRRYPCNDIGRWSPEGPPPHVDLYFPERVPSYNSPPGWLLP